MLCLMSLGHVSKGPEHNMVVSIGKAHVSDYLGPQLVVVFGEVIEH